MRLGIDTGGTFTDFVVMDTDAQGAPRLRTHKVLSTPSAPERAILQGIEALGLGAAVAAGKVRIVHGSTVATNAALEGKGVRTVFVTNHGFADLLTIGRQARPHLYRLQQAPTPPPVPPELCLETGGRVDARGQTLEALSEEELAALLWQLKQLRPQAVAVCLLFSFLDDSAERRIAAYLRAGLPERPFICHSAEVLPEYREYERGIATWLNASLGPLMEGYLLRLGAATAPSPLAVLQSSGGTIAAAQAARSAVNLLLSGPAGGLAAVDWLAATTGEMRLMSFDMGGTSTDVALYDGSINLTNEGGIGPWPVAVPMVDMHSIGAGGGSVAWVDSGSLLQVGPHSAGASPGPVCYGRGGRELTVTDANFLLGRLPAEIAGGEIRLDPKSTAIAFKDLGRKLGLTDIALAEGIIRLINEHMAQALRVISVARGHDPREFRLCCFGGAGGLHVCALAEELGMQHALVPVHAGVLSALGMLAAPAQRHYSRTCQGLLDSLDEAAVTTVLAEMTEAGFGALKREGHPPEGLHCRIDADLRYQGQSATLTLPWGPRDAIAEAFATLHAARYGQRQDAPVELVNLRVAVSAPVEPPALPLRPEGPPAAPLRFMTVEGCPEPVPVYARAALPAGQEIMGPALVVESGATTLLAPGWSGGADRWGHLRLERHGQ